MESEFPCLPGSRELAFACGLAKSAGLVTDQCVTTPNFMTLPEHSVEHALRILASPRDRVIVSSLLCEPCLAFPTIAKSRPPKSLAVLFGQKQFEDASLSIFCQIYNRICCECLFFHGQPNKNRWSDINLLPITPQLAQIYGTYVISFPN